MCYLFELSAFLCIFALTRRGIREDARCENMSNFMKDNTKKHRPSGIGKFFANALFGTIGSLPFWVLYGLSDIVALFVGGIFGYRRKVIRQNIEASFPEKSKKEKWNIEKEYYRWLGDYFVETLKLGRMSKKQIMRHMRFEGAEMVNGYLEKGHNVSLLLGHLGNWEWMSSIPLHLPEGIHAGQIYHPLENEEFDAAFLKIRSRFGAECISMRDTLPTVMKWRKEGRPFIIGYIADQVPLYENVHRFVDFLNHPDTPALTGHERLSRMLHAVVVYCHIRRVRRGEYVCRYELMTEDASKLPQFQLTDDYYKRLEANIRETPYMWLWSHKRWKRTKEGFFKEYGEEEAEKRLQHL